MQNRHQPDAGPVCNLHCWLLPDFAEQFESKGIMLKSRENRNNLKIALAGRRYVPGISILFYILG